MAGENGERRITWRVVAGVAGSIILLLATLIVNFTFVAFDSRMSAAEAAIDKKVDRTEHDKDMAAIKELAQIIREEVAHTRIDIKRHDERQRGRRSPGEDY